MAMNLRGLELGSKPAPGGLALVQGFVNTADLESGRDDLASSEALRDWLVRYGLLDPETTIADDERREVREVREALRDLLERHTTAPDPAALATLQRAAARSPLTVVFEGAASARLEPAATGVAGALGRLLAIVFTAMVEGTWQRLKVCQNETCRWAFYDHSKNRSGNWCTMAACGSRLKARAYRQRRAATG
jgi:predicted RNA-binding Zn ribbon-like protein